MANIAKLLHSYQIQYILSLSKLKSVEDQLIYLLLQ